MVDSPGDDDELGPAPDVAGKERIRAGVRAKLFGELDVSEDTEYAADSGLAPRKDVDANPDRIGRFRVLDRLGAGGMGVVYAAYDPELDRKIALKLLHPEHEGGSQGSMGASRLQREAQAMARLNHPNVVTVHEVGREGDRVFVAMEFIDGGTLRDWKKTDPTPAEILAKFGAAGRGLAAAHSAGLVHRDFKPDNVMLDAEGRVRVMDFGLSRSNEPTDLQREEPASELEASMREGIDPLATPLTATGAIMGTPAYMAPEQHLGRQVGPAADQFAFCVALWEALCGERPFPGRTYAELFTSVTEGNISAVPDGIGVQSRVVAALRRGLSVSADDRFESMDELLAELITENRSWRPWAIGGAAVIAAAVATYGLSGSNTVSKDACSDVASALDGVWGDVQRAEVKAALESTGAPYVPTAWATTERLLDDYAERWTAASRELCAAKLMADASQTESLQRRERCLTARRDELGQLVSLLSRDEEGLALQSVQAAATLSGVDACSDPNRLDIWAMPRNKETQEQIASSRSQLGLAKAKGVLGKYQEAIDLADEVVVNGRALDDPATQAAGLLVRGQYEERLGEWKRSETTLRAAVERAELAGDHGTRALALIRLVYVVGKAQKRFDEAKALAADAAAVLRVIGADASLMATLETNLGGAAREADELDEALAHYEKALDGLSEHYGDSHPETGRALTNVGSVLAAKGSFDAASEALVRAKASFEQTLGPEHPFVGVVLNNLGTNLARARRSEEAVQVLEKAVAVRRKSLGDEHRSVALSLYNLGTARASLRDYAAAEKNLREAIAIISAKDADDPRLVSHETTLAGILLAQGKDTEARELLERWEDALRETSGKRALIAREHRLYFAGALAASDRPRAIAMARDALGGHRVDEAAGRTSRREAQRIKLLKGVLWLLESVDRAPWDQASGGKQ